MRMFAGYRPNPPDEYEDKGITNSGDEPDYVGAIWPDGTVSVRWLTEYQSWSNWASWEEFEHVHGHPEYGTRIVYSDDWEPEPPPSTPPVDVGKFLAGMAMLAALHELFRPPPGAVREQSL